MTTLAERVRKAMERKKCSIPELATACRVKAPSVHGWLNSGSQSMKAGPAIRAAAYLGVSPIWLAEGEGPMIPSNNRILVPIGIEEPPNLKPEEHQILEGYRIADKSVRRIMISSAQEALAIFKKRTGKAA